MKLKIYCDGATSNNGYKNSVGGWAFVILDEKEEVIIERSGKIKPATNNICELTAAIKACAQIDVMEQIYRKNKIDEVEIYSDSAYLIQCCAQGWWRKWLENNWVNSKKEPVANQELWEQLIPRFLDNRFKFYKVKGHSNSKSQHSKWNNYVDRLAVEAKEKK